MIKKQILVVDDEVDICNTLERILRKRFRDQVDVKTACDGMEGKNRIGEFQFDLIITDINMPKLTGRELIPIIRQTLGYEATPIIVLTAYPDENLNGTIDKLVQFEKPVQIKQLVQQVSAFLNIDSI